MNKVFYKHYRPPIRDFHIGGVHGFTTNGGITLAIEVILKGTRMTVRVASAICSMKDRFSKKLGRKISQGRLECKREGLAEPMFLENVNLELGKFAWEAWKDSSNKVPMELVDIGDDSGASLFSYGQIEPTSFIMNNSRKIV